MHYLPSARSKNPFSGRVDSTRRPWGRCCEVGEQGFRGSSESSRAPASPAGRSNAMESKLSKSVVRSLSFAVFIVTAGLTTTGFVLTRHASQDQEQRLLKERSGEVAVLLSSSTNSLQSTLGLLGEVYAGGRD